MLTVFFFGGGGGRGGGGEGGTPVFFLAIFTFMPEKIQFSYFSLRK